MFGHSCTIYNKYRVGGLEKYQRTVLPQVCWQASRGVTATKDGLVSTDEVSLLIPLNAPGYLSPKAWLALEDKTGYWTLQSRDKTVKGTVDYNIQKTAAELDQFEDVMTITAVETLDYGGPMAHFEVRGK